jgi:hypothetical protein
MPRYFFVVSWHDQQAEDDQGAIMPNDDVAREFALRLVRELKEEGDFDDPGLKLVVKDEADNELFVIPFAASH